MSREPSEDRFQTIKAIWQENEGLYAFVGFILGLTIGFLLGLGSGLDGWFIDGIWSELLGIVFTLVFIDIFINRRAAQRELRNSLVRDAGSQSNEIARSAISELQKRGWLLRSDKITLLKGQDLRKANLRGADLKNAELSGVDLREADLQNTDLSMANLSGSSLDECKLQGALLVRTVLQGVSMVGADLSTADFSNSDLATANFTHAQLKGANLRGADLRGTNFARAELAGADIGYNPRSGLGKTSVQIDETTILPNRKHYRPQDGIESLYKFTIEDGQ